MSNYGQEVKYCVLHNTAGSLEHHTHMCHKVLIATQTYHRLVLCISTEYTVYSLSIQ